MTVPPGKRKRLLAVSSGGGHWVQLQRLCPAFEGWEVAYATVDADQRLQVGASRFHLIADGSMWEKLQLVRLAWSVLKVVLRERPAVVISTGAAPGYFALLFGKLIGASTIWVDSIANAEELSLSGRKVRRFADLWLTQWPDLVREGGPEYAGAVF